MKKSRRDQDFIHKPSFPGGPKAMAEFVARELKYPSQALAAGISGTVRVKISIDYQGTVVEAKVISGLGHGCDEEAMRVVQLMRFEVPRHRNLRITFHHAINIHFRLPAAPSPTQTTTYQYTVTKSSPPATAAPAASYSYLIQLGPAPDPPSEQ